MAPELKIYVPEESLETAKSFIATIERAEIQSVRKSIRDYREIEECLQDFRQRIVSLTIPKDPETETKILTGYKNLLIAMFGEDHPLLLGSRQTFNHIFLECTEQSPISFRGGHAKWEAGILTPHEVKVLIFRFGLDGGEGKSLREVGIDLDVGRERVRQIEAKALRKLRYQLRTRLPYFFR